MKQFIFTFPHSGRATGRKISPVHIFSLERVEFLCEDGKDGNPCELSNADE